MKIYKTFMGNYIDLEHILEITPVTLEAVYTADTPNLMELRGEVWIQFMFMENPRCFNFSIEVPMSSIDHTTSKGSWNLTELGKEQALQLLQDKVDTIVQAWKDSKVRRL